MKRSLYDVLGVDSDADIEAIESAYQAKLAELESAFDGESQSELKLLQHANAILADPEQREKYNKQLKLENLKRTSAIQYEEKKKEGSLTPLLLIALALSGMVYFGYRHYAREHVAVSTQQHITLPAASRQ